MPKHALVAALMGLGHEAVKEAAAAATVVGDVTSRTTLAALSVSQLISIFEAATDTSPSDAITLHEEWRYSGMKTLYLHTTLAELDPGSACELLNDAHEELLATLPSADDELESLTFVESSVFDSASASIVEVRYTYHATITFLDPRSEMPGEAQDLRTGFLWCADGEWVAICARSKQLSSWLSETVERATGHRVLRLHIPKEIQERVEEDQSLRRAACVDRRSKVSRRWTGKGFGRDNAAMREFRARRHRDEIPSTGYTVMLPDGTEMALGYNARHGRIYFSRELTVSMLREWAPEKVEQIIDAIEAQTQRSGKFALDRACAHLSHVKKAKREYAAELSIAVAKCRRGGSSEAPLPRRALDYADGLGNDVSVLPILHDDHGEPLTAACVSCGGDRLVFRRKEKAIICQDCGQSHKRRLVSDEGEVVRFGSVHDVVMLVPVPILMDRVKSAALGIEPSIEPDEAEYFVIHDRTLQLFRPSRPTVVALSQMSELSTLLKGTVHPKARAALESRLSSFREKCGHMSKVNCSTCVATRHGQNCFLRLFGLFDESFTPRPHEGHEYGDYARMVTVGGRQKQLVIMMKVVIPLRRT